MINPRQSNRAFALGFAVLALSLALNGFFYYRSTARLVDNESAVNHSHEVLRSSEQLLSLIKDAETGQRGYVITGESEYLQPYLVAKAIFSQMQALRTLVKDNPKQSLRLDQIDPVISAKISELDETIRLRRNSGEEAAKTVIKTDRGQRLMEQIRRMIAE